MAAARTQGMLLLLAVMVTRIHSWPNTLYR